MNWSSRYASDSEIVYTSAYDHLTQLDSWIKEYGNRKQNWDREASAPHDPDMPFHDPNSIDSHKIMMGLCKNIAGEFFRRSRHRNKTPRDKKLYKSWDDQRARHADRIYELEQAGKDDE